MKICTVCGETKSIDDFGKHAGHADGRASRCRGCANAAARTRYAADPSKIIARNASNYRRDKVKRYERQRVYVADHRERYREINVAYYAENRDRLRRMVDDWSRRHPERKREYEHRRRARVRAQFVEPVDIEKIFVRDRGLCRVCDLGVVLSEASPDHVVPISLGGAHAHWNVQLTHLRCNIVRGVARIPAQMHLPLPSDLIRDLRPGESEFVSDPLQNGLVAELALSTGPPQHLAGAMTCPGEYLGE